jgi:hemerythrin-like domain-containing protein
MERALSSTLGKAKRTQAALHGLKGVFRTLSEEHGEASALIRRLQKTSDPGDRARLFPQIRIDLLSHERAEIEEIYSPLSAFEETRQLAEEHDVEASEIEELLFKLNAVPFDDPEWDVRFDELVDVVEHHVVEEEGEYFPKANRVLSDDDDILARYSAARDRIKLAISGAR